jgi:hypothetical protein
MISFPLGLCSSRYVKSESVGIAMTQMDQMVIQMQRASWSRNCILEFMVRVRESWELIIEGHQ